MIYLVYMYGSGLRMCASHSHFRDQEQLMMHLKNDLEFDDEDIEELLDGDCVQDYEGDAFYYLINEVIDDNC